MIDHFNEHKAPFKVGDIIKLSSGQLPGETWKVLKITWYNLEHHGLGSCWKMQLSHRPSGKFMRALRTNHMELAHSAEENDESK